VARQIMMRKRAELEDLMKRGRSDVTRSAQITTSASKRFAMSSLRGPLRKQHLVTDRAAIERLSARNQAGSGAELFAAARDTRWHNKDMEFVKDCVEAV
jgi:hypothetical protein